MGSNPTDLLWGGIWLSKIPKGGLNILSFRPVNPRGGHMAPPQEIGLRLDKKMKDVFRKNGGHRVFSTEGENTFFNPPCDKNSSRDKSPGFWTFNTIQLCIKIVAFPWFQFQCDVQTPSDTSPSFTTSFKVQGIAQENYG